VAGERLVKLTIDTDAGTISRDAGGAAQTVSLYGADAFEWLSEQWVKVGWNCMYYQTFTWLGRPIIQLPEDLLRVQEVIYRLKPDVIVETGVAYGGSLVFYASLLKLSGGRRVIGVDLGLHDLHREAIAQHELAPFVVVVEGNSVDPAVVESVRAQIQATDRVMVVLDSCHSKDHVAAELEAYHPFVSRGSYIVATDGIMRDLVDVPGGSPLWLTDNPAAAAEEFAQRHPEFVLEQPPWLYNGSGLDKAVTYWRNAWLRLSSDGQGTPGDFR